MSKFTFYAGTIIAKDDLENIQKLEKLAEKAGKDSDLPYLAHLMRSRYESKIFLSERLDASKQSRIVWETFMRGMAEDKEFERVSAKLFENSDGPDGDL